MRFMLASLVLVALTGCSASHQDAARAVVEDWQALPERATEASCGDLYDQGRDEPQDGLVRCWTYEETDGLPDTFAALADDLSATIGAEAVVEPACMSRTEDSRTLACHAAWKVDGAVVSLGSGVTLHWLEDAVAAEVDWRDPELPARHEIIVAVLDELPADFTDLYDTPVG